MKASGIYAAIAALTATVVDARNLAIPKVTASVAHPLDGFTPKPTAPPGLHELFRRAGDSTSEVQTVLVAPDNTCGYISGRPGAGYTCFGTGTCVFFTSTSTRSGAIACCDEISCNLRLACINYNQYFSSSACDDGCAVDAYTLKCTETSAPYCNTISFSGGIQDYWCNNVDISTAQKASTTYRGETDGRSFEPLALTGSSSTEFVVTSGSIAGGPSATVDVTTVTATSGGSSDDESNSDSGSDKDDGGSKTPVGAIVGGVVGGVAAIGLVGIGIFFFLRRKNKKQAPLQQSPPADYVPPMQQQPGNGPQGYGPQGYGPVPQQSYYASDAQKPYPSPQSQYTQPVTASGFYPVQGQNTGPDSNDPSSPTTSQMTDPRLSHAPTSPSPSYAGSTVLNASPQPGFQPQQGTIHEASGSSMDHHRGQMHELA